MLMLECRQAVDEEEHRQRCGVFRAKGRAGGVGQGRGIVVQVVQHTYRLDSTVLSVMFNPASSGTYLTHYVIFLCLHFLTSKLEMIILPLT